MTLVGPSSSRPQWCPISLSSSIWAALPISSDDYCQMIIVSRSCQYLSAAVAANIVSRSCRYCHLSWMKLWKSLAILSDSSRISAELCSILADSSWNSTNTCWVFKSSPVNLTSTSSYNVWSLEMWEWGDPDSAAEAVWTFWVGLFDHQIFLLSNLFKL